LEAKATWKHELGFNGTATSGFTLPLGSDSGAGSPDDGFRPLELLLVGLAGCTGMDVISILKKKRQEVHQFEVQVHADQTNEHPYVFTAIEIEFAVTGHQVDPAAVERSIDLSVSRYCAAIAMLGKFIPITTKYVIHEG
jgi:putative redox protein